MKRPLNKLVHPTRGNGTVKPEKALCIPFSSARAGDQHVRRENDCLSDMQRLVIELGS
jgi:hypothetical protein